LKGREEAQNTLYAQCVLEEEWEAQAFLRYSDEYTS